MMIFNRLSLSKVNGLDQVILYYLIGDKKKN